MKINFNLVKTPFLAGTKNKKQEKMLSGTKQDNVFKSSFPFEQKMLFPSEQYLQLQQYLQQLNTEQKPKDAILENIERARANREQSSQNPFLKEVAKLKDSRSAELDLEKIKSIILPPKSPKQMRSFEDSDKKFILDRYQKDAIDAFVRGENVIVTAPTGMGKTLIAQYGIDDTIKKGKRIIYLSPLKALSNEKFTKFSELFGNYDKDGNFINSNNVGIITGDVVVNPEAQLIVMTTEIYRNMLNLEDAQTTAEIFKDFDGVIYDEFHYLGDPARGTVWEEAVINTPKHMKQMMLSATASNAQEINEWISKLNSAKAAHLTAIAENERFVPLNEYVYGYKKDKGFVIEPLYTKQINPRKLQNGLSDRQKQIASELESLYGQDFQTILKQHNTGGFYINSQEFAHSLMKEKGLEKDKAKQIAYALSDENLNVTNDIRLSYNSKNPPLVPLLKILEKQNKTPALFFIFSKKRCKEQLDEVSQRLGTLLTPEESKKVLNSINEAKESGIYLGSDFDEEYLPKLLMGYAIHHAGMLPAYKSLVEKLSREGLIKACFATETMLAGINMPFKTTVFTSADKFDGRSIVTVAPTTYKQGAGRAGRRGIDDIGNVIVCPQGEFGFETFKDIISSKDTKIRSHLNLNYAALLQKPILNNLDNFIEKSFLSYQANEPEKTKDIKKTLNNSYLSYHSSEIRRVKQDAIRRLNYLEEKGCIQHDGDVYYLTEKGEMAKNIYGINQVLLTELISDPKYTQDLTPEELAALMVIFADVKDDRPKTTFDSEMADVAQKLSPAITLAENIAKEQAAKKIDDEIKMSTNLVPAILNFAYMSSENREECIALWKDIFKELKSQYLIMHEGDLLRVFNGTIDLLKTVSEVTFNPELATKANLAINCLKKPPLTDILEYELNIK